MNIEADVALLALVLERQLQHRLVPVLGCPLVHWVRFVIVCGGNGRVDGLVIGVVGDDEGIDQGREGEEEGEQGEDCPGGEDAAGAVGVVKAFKLPLAPNCDESTDADEHEGGSCGAVAGVALVHNRLGGLRE